MTTTERLTQAHQHLTAAVEALTTGPQWAAMLDAAARFHDYSLRNVLLITHQRPDATHVAGYRTWLTLGRHVRKGEKGLAILAPVTYKKTDDNAETTDPAARVLRGFRIAHVFDITQTDGDALADIRPTQLDAPAPEHCWELLANQIQAAGFTIGRADCAPANGVTNHTDRTVIVRDDLHGAQAIKTLAHELAHVVLHDRDQLAADGATFERDRAEVEAESVAYLVCHTLGIRTDDYTFPYVARWSNANLDTVRTSAERAITTARRILEPAASAAASDAA